jgi:hypothetical protein
MQINSGNYYLLNMESIKKDQLSKELNPSNGNFIQEVNEPTRIIEINCVLITIIHNYDNTYFQI